MCKNRNRTKSAFAQSFGSFPGPTWSFVLGITFGKMIFFRVLGQPQILLACRKTGRKLSLWKGEGKALISGEKKIFKGSLKWVFGGFFLRGKLDPFLGVMGLKKNYCWWEQIHLWGARLRFPRGLRLGIHGDLRNSRRIRAGEFLAHSCIPKALQSRANPRELLFIHLIVTDIRGIYPLQHPSGASGGQGGKSEGGRNS